MKIGSAVFRKGQPVFFMDSAKTSTLEGSATSVYATGGRGNVRLVAWEGEKVITMTVEDALISPISFAMLSGAGVVKGATSTYDQVHAHMTTATTISKDSNDKYWVDLTDALGRNDKVCATAPIFIMGVEGDGSITGVTYEPGAVDTTGKKIEVTDAASVEAGLNVLVDYYILKDAAKVTELQVDAANFGGYFYIEADTLFRAQIDGKDYPANITIPNAKIQSNWTFTMAATGDPSTFTFTMDVMPGYTYFDQTKKVLVVIQIIEDADDSDVTYTSVMAHTDGEENRIEGTEEEAGAVPYDNVPNTAVAWAKAYGYTRVPTSAEYASGTYYKFVADAADNKEATRFVTQAVTEQTWGTLVAAGLYTKNT
jgi:hypothetical protein